MLSATCTIVHRDVQPDVLSLDYTCLGGAQCDASLCSSATIVLIQYLFPDVYLVCHGGGLTTKVVSHYGQVYVSQKVCVSEPMFIGLFFLVLVSTTTSQNIRHFLNTLYTRLSMTVPMVFGGRVRRQRLSYPVNGVRLSR